MKILLTISFLLLGSCAHQRVHLGDGMSSSSNANYEKSQPFFVNGIGQTQDVKAKDVCGSRKVVAVESSQTFLDGFLGALTFGIYTPRTMKIFCK